MPSDLPLNAPPPDLLQRRELRTTDIAEVQRYLGRLYRTAVEVEMLDGRGRSRSPLAGLLHRRVDAGSFALEDVRHGGHAETRADAGPGVVVLWAVNGHVRTQLDDDVGAAGPGDILLGSAGDARVRMRSRDPWLKTMVLEQSLIDRVASDSTVTRATSVRFTSVSPRSPDAAAAWIKARRFVEETVLAADAIATPLVIASAARLLAATTLAVFPNTASEIEDPVTDVDLSEHPSLVRRAIDYIGQHIAEDVGVADIAAAVYVTPRALQYMFRRHLETTPMSYLRRLRLEHVHRELREGSRDSTTVTAIAARWGFAHTGRFAVLYRETYGQSPHVTLRQ